MTYPGRNHYEEPVSNPIAAFVLFLFAVIAIAGLVGGGCYYAPKYNVYEQEKAGEAELARADSNRRIAVLEAQAKLDSAKLLADAEIARSRGVAEANKIIGEGLKGHEEYLRYLWIMSLEHSAQHGMTTVYVPTEANLPILEARGK